MVRYAPKPKPDHLTAKEAAQYLGVSVKAIYANCRRCRYPNSYKLGRDWRIPKRDLDIPRHRGRPPKNKTATT